MPAVTLTAPTGPTLKPVLDLSASPRVSAEWIGKAREFRNRVKLIDAAIDPVLATITKPLRARLQRHPRLRHEMIAGAERLYRKTIPAEFRIGEVEVVKDRAEFAISETRLIVSWLRETDWDPDYHEVGLSICRFSLTLHHGSLRERWTPTCNVSLHALARRIERGRERDHDALLRDITVLANAGDDGERVDTPGGYWLGGVIAAGASKRAICLRNVRTWIDRDEVAHDAGA